MANQARIMVIDDDRDHLLICVLVFERKGYKVLALPGCQDEQELTDAVTTFQPNLIFMDHHMHGLCGPELTKILKSSPTTKDIPVIYFTSETDIERLAKEAGADGFFRKPFQITALLATAATYVA